VGDRFYTTEALVLAERESGERAKILTLFSRELGLVYVHGAGLRRMESKLRYNLELYSLCLVSLVPGKENWKLVGAENSRKLPVDLSCAAAISQLMLRLMGTHVLHPELFDEIMQGGEEARLKVCVLDHLGYVGKRAENQVEAQGLIDRALYASQL